MRRRETLERRARRPKSARSLTLRRRTVLACASGATNDAVAADVGVHPATVGKGRRRFAARRLDRLSDGHQIGSSVTRPFCGECTRLRLSADGKLFTCLFSNQGHDLRKLLRAGGNVADFIAGVWEVRSDRYSELRT